MQICNKCGRAICGEQSGSSRGKLITIGDYNSFYFDLCDDCYKGLHLIAENKRSENNG